VRVGGGAGAAAAPGGADNQGGMLVPVAREGTARSLTRPRGVGMRPGLRARFITQSRMCRASLFAFMSLRPTAALTSVTAPFTGLV
jgi:hypothetical protein